MKKIIGSVIGLLLFSLTSEAQIRKGAYASFDMGYNIGTNTNTNVYY